MDKEKFPLPEELKFTKKQQQWIKTQMGNYTESVGDFLIEQLQSYKDMITDKIDVLYHMGVEMIPTENLYNMFDGKETDTEEKKIGF